MAVVLAATGLIVGESLFGVAYAGIVAAAQSKFGSFFANKETPLAVVGDSFEKPGIIIGMLLFAGAIAALYRYSKKSCQAA